MRRRAFLALGGSVALDGCVGQLPQGVGEPPALTPVDPEDAWPFPQHGPHGGSATPDGAGPDPATATEQWQYGSPSRIQQPVADGERLYATVGYEVRALDPGTGEERWVWDGARVDRSPMVAAGTVYAVANARTESDSGTLVAIDADAGTGRWSRDLPSVNAVLPFASSVLVSGERDLVLLDAATGEVRTRYTVRDRPVAFGEPVQHGRRLVADGTTVYVPLVFKDGYPERGQVVALDLDGPRVRWRSRRFEYGRPNALAVVDDTLVVGTNVALWGLDAADGTFRWRQLGHDYPFFRFTAGSGLVVVDDGDTIVAYDADDGTEQWRAPGDGFRTTITGETLYTAVHTPPGELSGLRAYDAATGEQRAKFSTTPLPDLRPVVAEGRLFTLVRPGGSRLTCYA